MNSNKPNILIFMADQLTALALSAYGNKTSKTPHLDQLADQGVVFESAYCNSPLCAPSRASFMTGRLASQHRVYDNAAEFGAAQPSFAHHLRLRGYQTILAGKMHFCGPDQLHGFEERLTTDIYPADFGWTPDWQHPHVRLDWYHNMSSVTDAGRCVRTNQLDFDDEVTFATRQKLFDLVRNPDPRPFCLVMSLTHPHDPFAMPQRYLDRYADTDIDLPSVTLPDEQQDAHSRRIQAMCGLNEQTISEEQTRRARHAYYAAVSYVDDQIGTILQTLEETGQVDNTTILVLADHGDMLGERGLWYKMHFFEGALRVPLILHASGRFSAQRIPHPVSLVDILPTLLDLAGTDTPKTLPDCDGHSLLSYLSPAGASAATRTQPVYAEYLAEGAIAPIIMIRRNQWKLIYSEADPTLLFDLDRDPQELENIANHPAYQQTVHDLLQEVHEHWNLPQLHQDILRSQQERLLVADALQQGQYTAWDHQPVRDASRLYIRNTQTLDEQEAFARYPRVHAHSLTTKE